MADYTRFKDGVPILRPVEVPDQGKGNKAIAEVFGKVAHAISEKAIDIGEEMSNASLYQASNQIYRIKHEAHENFLENPDQTSKITEDTVNNIKNLISKAQMNSAHKSKLEYMANNDMTDIKMTGLRIGAD